MYSVQQPYRDDVCFQVAVISFPEFLGGFQQSLKAYDENSYFAVIIQLEAGSAPQTGSKGVRIYLVLSEE